MGQNGVNVGCLGGGGWEGGEREFKQPRWSVWDPQTGQQTPWTCHLSVWPSARQASSDRCIRKRHHTGQLSLENRRTLESISGPCEAGMCSLEAG
ncbi:hypothetical protein NHX12_008159, partial [Muraenolepis orangiensis]